MEQDVYTLADAKAFEKVKDYAKAADVYFELGEYQKAEQLYRTLEQRFPFHKDVKFKLGKILTVVEKWNEAIIKLQEVGNAGIYTEETLYLLAECFKNKGLIHAAKEMYADLLERNYHYKDARKKLQALDAPGLSDLAVTQNTVITSTQTDRGIGTNPLYQTVQGFSVEDRYTLVEELGRGGMGIVYKAEDIVSKGFVAIKVLPPHLATDKQNRIRFFREAEVIADLHHPNIVTLLEVNQQDNFIVMEYLPGGTLSHWKQEHGLTYEKLLPYIRQVLDALHIVHQQGIIHRDIKPENILIVDQSTAKLTDFGIAHICGATITHTGTHLGTIPYMSPEQIIGKNIDLRSDIYAIGVLLYELSTEQLPFTGKETSYHHVYTSPRPPLELDETIPSKLNEIILKCLMKTPEERYQDAETLRTVLEGI